MDLSHQGFGKKSARDSGLIGHDNYGDSSFVESSNRCRRVRKDFESGDMVDISHLVRNRAIAIEKHSMPFRSARHAAAPRASALPHRSRPLFEFVPCTDEDRKSVV